MLPSSRKSLATACPATPITSRSPPSDGDGAYRVMRAAIKDAKLVPEDIGYVNAHGTSTPLGDVIETRALKRVFGENAKNVPVSSTKSMTGHLLGGAGGLEAGISVLALRDQILPPTINLETPDPECDLDYVPNVARKASVEYALSNSFGFGGTNAALIFKRWSGQVSVGPVFRPAYSVFGACPTHPLVTNSRKSWYNESTELRKQFSHKD